MKILISSLISVVVMILFCIAMTFILRLSAYLFVGGDFLFSLKDAKEGVIVGAMLGVLLSFGIWISDKLIKR